MEWTPEKILELRTAYGQTQEQFARRLRVHAQSVRRWEQGLATPPGPVTALLDVLTVLLGPGTPIGC